MNNPKTQNDSIEEAKKLLRGSLSMELLKIAERCLLPFFWSTPQEDGNWIINNNASAFLLDCGQGPFIVTAAHVYKGFLKKKTVSKKIEAQLGDLKFDPTSRLIDIGKESIDPDKPDIVKFDPDIATFKVEPNEIETLDKTPFKGDQNEWPPLPPQAGKGIFFAGFPGKERRMINNRTCEFGMSGAIAVATTINERYISCQFERSDCDKIPNLPFPPEGYDFGGMSGAPVITGVERINSGIFTWRLGGIISHASRDLGEIFWATRADYIQPDGQLNK